MNWPLPILHLSDLHFGLHGRFSGQDMKALARRFHQGVEDARKDLGWMEKVGLCLITGDIAEASRPGEYDQALTFFEELIGIMGLSRERLVFIPGNHDVSWNLTKRVLLEQDDERFDEVERDRRIQERKFMNFEHFLRRFYGKDREELPGVQPLGHGAFIHAFPEERLAVAALNSCERESHLLQGGFLGSSQAQALMGQWRQGDATQWFKIIAIHHNPVATVPENVKEGLEQLKKNLGTLKPEWLDHFAADIRGFTGHELLRNVAEDCQVQVVLHGHHHAGEKGAWPWRKGTSGQTLVLSAGSWGLQPDRLPENQPNMLHLIRLSPDKKIVQSVFRVYEPRARAEGHVVPGDFTIDAASPEGAKLPVILPQGFVKKRAKPNPKTIESGKAQEFIQEYRARLQRKYERWELAGVGAIQPGGAGKPIEATLDDMYLPQRLAEGYDTSRLDAGDVLDPGELLTHKRPLVIRGAAGSGKTTWMRWTFRRLVGIPGVLPFMIELRRLARVWGEEKVPDRERTLEAYLLDWLEAEGVSGWKNVLSHVLKAEIGPRPILLVDGWDELGELGQALRERLVGFLTAYPRVLAVVSSRPYGQSRPSRVEGFEVLDLQPLADKEIAYFTEQFHRRVHGEDASAAQASAQRFQVAVSSSPEALSLARTPLLLTMMLLISRDRPLPDKRHRLYEECIRNLLSARPDQREKEGAQLEQHQWRPVDSEERLRVVANVAFMMQQKGYSTRRRQIVRSGEELMAILPENWKREEKSGFLAWLVGAAGVMIDRTDGSLSFTHLSFQEYLTAHFLAVSVEGDESRVRLCQERMEDVDWWETLRLWAGIVSDRNPVHLVSVLRTLMQGKAESYWLTGAILADGSGEEAFQGWLNDFSRWVGSPARRSMNASALAWSASRQEVRRQAIAKVWPRLSREWNWLETTRAEDWYKMANINIAATGVNAREAIIRQMGDGQGIGRARVLLGAHPFLSGGGPELALLRLVPTPRASLAARLQTIHSLGASREEFFRAARHILEIPTPTDRVLQGSLKKLTLGFLDEGTVRSAHWEFLKDLAQDLIRDLGKHWGQRWTQGWAPHWLHHVVNDTMLVPTDLEVGKWLRHLGRHMESSWASKLAQDWGYGGSFPAWIENFAGIEVASAGRVCTRAWIANSKDAGIPHKELFRLACRVSLNPKVGTASLQRALAAYPTNGEPLWPALARHLARCSSGEDRLLLADLVQHPEKRPPPLSWGLKYYVRGDIVFDDGSEMTLDDLCQQLRMPLLPYLGEMPSEVHLKDNPLPKVRKSAGRSAQARFPPDDP